MSKVNSDLSLCVQDCESVLKASHSEEVRWLLTVSVGPPQLHLAALREKKKKALKLLSVK